MMTKLSLRDSSSRSPKYSLNTPMVLCKNRSSAAALALAVAAATT